MAEATDSAVGAVIVPLDTIDFPKPHLRHSHPRQAFGKLLHLFNTPYLRHDGIHETAVIDPTATVDPLASIGPYCVIEKGAEIHAHANVMAFAYVGENCTVGERTIVMPHATLLRNVTLGKFCEIGPGAVLGHAGFGYYWDGEKQVHVPQVGGVILSDRVDVGANSAIDRATADNTTIGEGNKFDNLVQVGHNVQIGKHGVFASQVGISGSTTIGNRMTAGGQSGFADHVTVIDNVAIAGRAGVMGTIDTPGIYGGAPCVPILQFHRSNTLVNDLPNLVKRIKSLEKKLAELESGE